MRAKNKKKGKRSALHVLRVRQLPLRFNSGPKNPANQFVQEKAQKRKKRGLCGHDVGIHLGILECGIWLKLLGQQPAVQKAPYLSEVRVLVKGRGQASSSDCFQVCGCKRSAGEFQH